MADASHQQVNGPVGNGNLFPLQRTPGLIKYALDLSAASSTATWAPSEAVLGALGLSGKVTAIGYYAATAIDNNSGGQLTFTAGIGGDPDYFVAAVDIGETIAANVGKSTVGASSGLTPLSWATTADTVAERTFAAGTPTSPTIAIGHIDGGATGTLILFVQCEYTANNGSILGNAGLV